MNTKYFYFLFIFILIFFINCYEQTITINENNKSGIIEYNIDIYKDFELFLSYINKNQRKLDKFSILLNKNNINNIVDKNNIIKLLKYNLNKNDYSSVCNFILNFENLYNLPKELPNEYFPTRISEKRNTITVVTVINLRDYINKLNIKLNSDEYKIIETYSDIIKIKFVYNVPKRIINKNLGELSNNDKQLIYETTLSKILLSKDKDPKIEIEFSYTK